LVSILEMIVKNRRASRDDLARKIERVTCLHF